ncbi:uncharacterized protein UV8b_02313 [Ustilaginoidea virens]|uniref:Uncharacterized protein n=1 Tax=Ustilaginoidea virens TaxID=1159556 RepID=A0A8E5HMJ7_USTVR|nr:uncharacterized protein UV8b_02313 [Ustilaginoidea virens]QUC18072.1 hypothetical protein UV8b_02313 [Ustilaginoidea virens]
MRPERLDSRAGKIPAGVRGVRWNGASYQMPDYSGRGEPCPGVESSVLQDADVRKIAAVAGGASDAERVREWIPHSRSDFPTGLTSTLA